MNGPDEIDVAVVGGGIVGLATALAISRRHPDCALAVLEKEDDVGRHQTGHNSGVIHSGIYYKPGSAKARLCVEGARLMTDFCEENGIPYERCGKVIVATEPGELERLQSLLERGLANGVEGLRLIGPQELREIEPHARAVRALHSRATAIVDFAEVARALRRRLEERGGSVRTGVRVTGLAHGAAGLRLSTTRGELAARHVVNCAGLYSDAVALSMRLPLDTRIIPFRGEYYTIRPERRLVRGLIYPVPDPRFPFLGVHFTRRIGGEVEAGPNAVLAFAREGYRMRDVDCRELLDTLAFPGFRRMARRYWRTGAYELYRSLSRRAFVRDLARLVPEITDADLAASGSGVRAQAVLRDGSLLDDFRIVEAPGSVHVINAPSPAATASLAIGRHIAAVAARSFSL